MNIDTIKYYLFTDCEKELLNKFIIKLKAANIYYVHNILYVKLQELYSHVRAR